MSMAFDAFVGLIASPVLVLRIVLQIAIRVVLQDGLVYKTSQPE